MAFQLKALQTALMGTLGTCLLAVAAPTFAQTTPERLERVEVTGSNIKRTDTETVAPVEVITREDIARSGRPTIGEVLRALPVNSGGSFNEQNANGFSPGSSGISLRGLGQKATLVLINGRRTANAGFAQSITDTFVDLNTIPSSAIERVEILKDGASAIYGSDAIAGVVNIILRKDFQGLEGTIGGGRSEGKNEYSANIAGGFGDLSRDKFNVFASLDLYKRDLLELSDTEFGKTRDFRSQQGGRNLQSLTGGGTWQQFTPNGTATPVATNNFRAISGCQGTVMNGPQAVAAGLINLSANQTAATLATNTARAAASNTYCTYDFDSQFTTYPETERIGFQTRGNYQFTPTTLGYADIGLNRTTTKQTFQDNFFAGNVGFVPNPGGLVPFPFNITFAPGSSGNPFSTIARFNGVQTGLGTRDSKIISDTARFLLGLQYVVAGWDLDSGVGMSRNNSEAQNLNRATLSGTASTLGVTTAVQPPIPTSLSATYNLDNPAANSQALNDSILTNFSRKSRSQIEFADTKATTEIQQLRLPGGPVAIAVGGEIRKEILQDRPADILTGGNIMGSGSTATDGSRRTYSAYVEFDLPFFKELEGQVAGRFDHYSDYGSSKTPKFGLKYKPSDIFLVRGNYGRGFRAPSLTEISKSSSTFFSNVTDPQDGLSHQITGVNVANPNLKPESSVSASVGFVLEPTKSFNTGLDVYRIRWRNVVATQGLTQILTASCPLGRPPCPSTSQVIRDPSTNALISILAGYLNVADRRTVGVDWDASYTLPVTEFGKFVLRSDLNYIHSYTENGVECVGHQVCTFDIPRIKATFVLDYDYGPVSVTGRMNYTHHIARDFPPANAFVDTNDPRFQNGALQAKAPSYRTYDLTARYTITKNLSINAALVNIFNQLPPYDSAFTNVYDSSLYDVRGRQYRASLTYKM
jgi:iron complex outermembrane receptor protein